MQLRAGGGGVFSPMSAHAKVTKKGWKFHQKWSSNFLEGHEADLKICFINRLTREKSEIYLYCDLNFCDTSLQSFHLERGKLWMWFAKQLPSNQANILCSSEYRVDWSSTINYCPDTIAAPVLKFDTKLCISNFLPSLPQFDTNVINCQCCAKSRKLMCFWCQQSFKNMDVDCKAY